LGLASATVAVRKGRLSCREARSLARQLISGKAKYVDNGYSYQNYFSLPGGWRGSIHTGAWSLDNKRRRIALGGDVKYDS